MSLQPLHGRIDVAVMASCAWAENSLRAARTSRPSGGHRALKRLSMSERMCAIGWRAWSAMRRVRMAAMPPSCSSRPLDAIADAGHDRIVRSDHAWWLRNAIRTGCGNALAQPMQMRSRPLCLAWYSASSARCSMACPDSGSPLHCTSPALKLICSPTTPAQLC